jgi:hypothetical protein
MERKLGSWAKSLEDVTTDMGIYASTKKNTITSSYQGRAANDSFDACSSYRRKRGWAASIHWDLLH